MGYDFPKWTCPKLVFNSFPVHIPNLLACSQDVWISASLLSSLTSTCVTQIPWPVFIAIARRPVKSWRRTIPHSALGGPGGRHSAPASLEFEVVSCQKKLFRTNPNSRWFAKCLLCDCEQYKAVLHTLHCQVECSWRVSRRWFRVCVMGCKVVRVLSWVKWSKNAL
jgi:hypothetical protein